LSVIAQLRRHQMEFCGSASEYATNAVVPANLKTDR